MRSERFLVGLLVVLTMLFTFACTRNVPGPVIATQPPVKSEPASPTEPAALPTNGFKAELALVEPPQKMRGGQKETVRVKIKNVSDVTWWARGAPINPRPDNKFYIAAGNRWLKADGSLLTNMDGRYGINKDLKPGEETEVPLTITAPAQPGDYTLEIDLLQEQVAWFSDKGSATAKTKITVVK